MGEINVVYCLGCQQLVSVREAKYIFRTGFYRQTIPLACCDNCKHNKDIFIDYSYFLERDELKYATL